MLYYVYIAVCDSTVVAEVDPAETLQQQQQGTEQEVQRVSLSLCSTHFLNPDTGWDTETRTLIQWTFGTDIEDGLVQAIHHSCWYFVA